MRQRTWLLLIIALVIASGLCMMYAPASFAQQKQAGRVTEFIGTDENRIELDLPVLEIGDIVEIEFTRLSGDLVPIVALVNEGSIVFRYRDLNQDGRLDENTYELNEEAGAGDYTMVIAADPEIDRATTGDYMIIYTIRRGAQILNETISIVNPDEHEVPVILLDAPELAADRLILRGTINDDVVRVDYLIPLSAGLPLQFVLSATEGDLVPLLGISPADDSDFEVENAVDGVVTKIFPEFDDSGFDSGYYVLAVTRDGVDEGDTSGEYMLEITLAPPPEEEE